MNIFCYFLAIYSNDLFMFFRSFIKIMAHHQIMLFAIFSDPWQGAFATPGMGMEGGVGEIGTNSCSSITQYIMCICL